ncbi:hypothetical protein PLESTB_001821800 [Pleodorina starrii]|uniref:Uncharacterized protein n=1 Tax=Pleodorina starrii TaxID=330485 RepID=A0A9W6C2J9_9CHLO|nr:hypothetical protein PLESTB_001821800 [Pleodorina starrii]
MTPPSLKSITLLWSPCLKPLAPVKEAAAAVEEAAAEEAAVVAAQAAAQAAATSLPFVFPRSNTELTSSSMTAKLRCR